MKYGKIKKQSTESWEKYILGLKLIIHLHVYEQGR